MSMRHLLRPHAANRARLRVILAVAAVLLALTIRPVLAGFQGQQSFGTGALPISVAAADFNGDGKPDLAVVSFNNASVSVLLNTTAGGANIPTFATHVPFAAGILPTSVAVADLNGDGKPDIAVANSDNINVGVLLNTTVTGAGTPTFAAQVTFATGASPTEVAAADFNGDGKPDLAVTNRSSNTVSVLLNTTATGAGTPTFAIQVPFATGLSPTDVAAADLNGDGKPDLAVVNSENGTNTISVLLNTTANGAGTPTFTAQATFATGSLPGSVAAADLNGDGRPDLAVANLVSNTVSVLLNTTPNEAGTPVFAPQAPFSTGARPISVAAADLNGDGKPDLSVANFDGDTVGVLLNTTASGAGIPTFAAQTAFTTGTDPRAVVAEDLNDDGKPDLAVANNGSTSVSVLLANPSGALQFSSPGGTVTEGISTAGVTLARTGSTDGQVSGIVSITGGTATPGQDFTLASPLTVTWADGDGADKTVSIPITQDQVDEGTESFQAVLTLPTNRFATVLAAQTTTELTITDDDPLTLSVANVSQPEGNAGTSTAAFTVTRAGSTVRTVTVQYATADGSAKAGSDYTATSGTLTFAPNEASRTIFVPILGDTLAEPDESFTVTLSSPTNATLGVGTAVGIIQNDDVVVACTPRPLVTQTLVAGSGALNVRIESTPLNTPANNPLQTIRFGAFQNATVSLNGQLVTSGQTVTLPPGVVFADTTVRRVVPGQPTTVHFTVLDGCGEWTTFVGGGSAAGF